MMRAGLFGALFLVLLGGTAALAQLMTLGIGSGGSSGTGNLLQEGGAGAILQENSSKIQVQQ